MGCVGRDCEPAAKLSGVQFFRRGRPLYVDRLSLQERLAESVFTLQEKPDPSQAAVPVPEKYRAIAVIPFADLSEAGDQARFAEGIAEIADILGEGKADVIRRIFPGWSDGRHHLGLFDTCLRSLPLTC